jgi:dTDP-4-dehydrorhamnose reductase
MKVLVTGGHGQLGRSVVRRGTAAGHTVVSPDVDELDICSEASVTAGLATAEPDLVINAAAYTAVDKAESESDRAFTINRDGAGILARACASRSTPLLHVSTDYVFDGAGTRAYREDDAINPLSVYGASKAAGEALVNDAGGTVVRTSWLFEGKGPSFVHTMLRLAKERPLMKVVADQQGCPTWADDLADGLLALAAHRERASVYHYVNDGVTTWHAFASAIIELARTHRPLAVERVEAITTAEYPTPAKRPANSVLDTSRIRALGIVPPHWRTGLAQVIAQELASPKAGAEG